MTVRTDQPMPEVNNRTDCQTTLASHLMQDITASRDRGIETYGTALQPLNGRDAVRDAYEEWIDLGMYLEQLKRERAIMVNFIQNVASEVLHSAHMREAQRILQELGENTPTGR